MWCGEDLRSQIGGGGALVFKGGYDARTRKQVKRVVFFPTVDVRAYIEKGVKNIKILKKGYGFQPLKLCKGIILTAEIKIKRVYLTARSITYSFRVKTDKNTCLGYVF